MGRIILALCFMSLSGCATHDKAAYLAALDLAENDLADTMQKDIPGLLSCYGFDQETYWEKFDEAISQATDEVSAKYSDYITGYERELIAKRIAKILLPTYAHNNFKYMIDAKPDVWKSKECAVLRKLGK